MKGQLGHCLVFTLDGESAPGSLESLRCIKDFIKENKSLRGAEKINITKLLLACVKPDSRRRTSEHTLKLSEIPCLGLSYVENVLTGSSGDYPDK